MKKVLISILALILMLSLLSSTAFAYTTLTPQSAPSYGTYTVDVGVIRTIIGYSNGAANSSYSAMTLSFLGTLQGSSPTEKTIAVAIYDTVHTTKHQYNITTNRAGYTNTLLSALSTKNYDWQTGKKSDSYNSCFAGACPYSYTVTSFIETMTYTGTTQGNYSNISINIAS